MTVDTHPVQHFEHLDTKPRAQPAPPSREWITPTPAELEPRRYEDARPAWVPAASLWEGPDAYVFVVDLPGVARADLSVRFFLQLVEIQGTRTCPALDGANAWAPRWSERRDGAFQRTLPLPPDASIYDAHVELRDGVLVIRLGRDAHRASTTGDYFAGANRRAR